MTEAAPPHPPNPGPAVKHAGKAMKGKLTGHPKWVYIAGITVLIGVAYFAWQKSRNAAAPPVDGETQAFPEDPNAGFYPDSTQGAFGGYSDPGFFDNFDSAGDPQERTDPNPVVVNIGFPSPSTAMVSSVDPQPQSVLASVPTGGGVQSPRTVAAHWSPPPAGVYAGVAYDAHGAPLSTPSVASVMATKSLKGTNVDLKSQTAPQGFPNRGPKGWYSNQYDPHRKRHYHQYQSGEKVWL